MKESIKRILNKLPYLRTLESELDKYKTPYPPGHYCSPTPSIDEIQKREKQIFTIPDDFYPFEYPKEWILRGDYLNEAYLLRCFLQNNNQYSIMLFNNYLKHVHESWLSENIPLFLQARGSSIWMQKL